MKRVCLLIATLATVLALAAARTAIAESQDHAAPSEVAAEAPHAQSAEPAHAEDAGHGEVNPIPGPAAGIITSLTTFLVFLGLVVILSKYAWGPIVAGLKAREDKIRADIEAAERARGQADTARRQFEEQMAGAEARVRELIARAQNDGQQLAARIRAQAQEEAEDIKQKAIREIEQSQREAMEEIRTQAANLATSVAEKILRREVNQDDQRRLIEASLDEFQTIGAK